MRYVFDERGDLSRRVVAQDADGGPVFGPMERPSVVPPPCSICPKWPADAGDPKPLTGVEDLFAVPWFHDCREAFLEGRAVGAFGDPDPFTRAAYAEFDVAERRLDRRAAGDTVAALARILSRRN